MRLAKIRTTDGVVLAIGLPNDELVRADYLDAAAPRGILRFLELPEEQRRSYERQAAALVADAGQREHARAAGALMHVDEAQLDAPVDQVPKLICLALNYRAHADEGGFDPPARPVIFLKGTNSLCGHGTTIELPPLSRRIDHEGELAVMIGRRCKGLDEHSWRSAIAGYTMINDLTARDLQLEDIERRHPWDFTKSFDTFGPTGPWLVTPDEVPDPQALELELRVNGEIRQKSDTSKMIFGVRELLIWISAVMTLEPGDIIATGTCDGIGPAGDGALMELRIGSLGVLRNRVRFLH